MLAKGPRTGGLLEAMLGVVRPSPGLARISLSGERLVGEGSTHRRGEVTTRTEYCTEEAPCREGRTALEFLLWNLWRADLQRSLPSVS